MTEAVHLVDIVNQTDLVEEIEGEEKLGQPMVHLTRTHPVGTFDLFLLPGARKRTFPGREGRLRTPLPVDSDRATFESGRGHVGGAARWSRSAGIWDVGLSHFFGTTREPQMTVGFDPTGRPALIPHYAVIHQSGLDVQAVSGQWLWKLETIYRTGQNDPFSAAAGGFEYTLPHSSGLEIGLILEYLFDDRGGQTLFDDDLAIGCRLGFNDLASSEMLASVIVDREGDESIGSLTASRRVGEAWKVFVEGRTFQTNGGVTNPLFGFRRDDHLALRLTRYF